MPVNEKILFGSFQYIFFSKNYHLRLFCRRQCCAKITLFFWGKNIDFRGGGGINIRFQPKYRPLRAPHTKTLCVIEITLFTESNFSYWP
jgi:hypothetical protein